MWLFGAVVATVGYLAGLVLWLLPATELCDHATGWLAPYFSCLTANELGDFLAGAFAPVAFLWLVTAVFIQSRELAAQREELKATRQEVSDNRKVMEEQARQAQRQADFIEEQTENLKRAEAERQEESRDRAFEHTLEVFYRLHLLPISQKTSDIETASGSVLLRFPDFDGSTTDFAMTNLNRALHELNNALALPSTGKRDAPIGDIAAMCEPLKEMTKLTGDLSVAFRIRAGSLAIADSLAVARTIVERETFGMIEQG